MKIVTSQQMALLESEAYRHGLKEEFFMENAGKGIAGGTHAFIQDHHLAKEVSLLCGKGNNAGDAYVAGIYLLSQGYTVSAIQIVPLQEASALCRKNAARFQARGGSIYTVSQSEQITFPAQGVILDGLFGTGFHGKAREPYATAIHLANASGLPILAIDIPSGLNGSTGEVAGAAIIASKTFFLGLPKRGFFLQKGWDHVGKLQHVDFGLPTAYIDAHPAEMVLLDQQDLKHTLPSIENSRHKYQAGYVVGLAGSPGMPGAAFLSGYAALRAGAGIVKMLYPAGMEAELSAGPYELIKISYTADNPSTAINLLNEASAVFIGPGIGRTEKTKACLEKILSALHTPCVIDADALTLTGTSPFPKGAILTPHIGEMRHLLPQAPADPHSQDFLIACQKYSEKHQVTLVLKGGPTFLFHPGEPIYINARSDPGMATAGSGDVLTGIIAALLAQTLPPLAAAKLGVFLHGIAGEQAACKKTSYSLIASDLIEALPQAFQSLMKNHLPDHSRCFTHRSLD